MTSKDHIFLYDNERYFVIAVNIDPTEGGEPYVDGRFTYFDVYAVVNKETDVWEHVCVQLPEACFTAMSLNSAMEMAPWHEAKKATPGQIVETVN
jgi:hypothetical protein